MFQFHSQGLTATGVVTSTSNIFAGGNLFVSKTAIISSGMALTGTLSMASAGLVVGGSAGSMSLNQGNLYVAQGNLFVTLGNLFVSAGGATITRGLTLNGALTATSYTSATGTVYYGNIWGDGYLTMNGMWVLAQHNEFYCIQVDRVGLKIG